MASVVDRAARRTVEATKARAEANALAVLSHSLLHAGGRPGAAAEPGLRGVRHDRGRGTAPRRRRIRPWSRPATATPPPTAAEADAEIAVTPDVTLVFRGRPLQASDRSLLTAYAAHLTVLRERRLALAESQHAAELAEANRTRTALLAAVSHDLRSPLSAIKAAVSSLRNTEIAWSADDEAELLATIEGSADRLETLVGNLLDMSRLQMGAINPLTTELDLGSAVEWTLDSITGGDRVEVVLEPDAPTAEVDPGLLDRVIANVVENALRHTPDGTRVQIQSSSWTGEDQRRWVSIRVVDHGPGIPEPRARRCSRPSNGWATCPPATASDWVWRWPVD